MTSHTDPIQEHAPGHSHTPTSFKVLLRTFIALLILTALTVWTSRIDIGQFNSLFLPLQVELGWLNIIVAMGIATLKMSIVAAFFMGLRYDKPFNTLIFIGTFVFLAIFIVYTLTDTLYRGRIYSDQAMHTGFESPVKLDTAVGAGNRLQQSHSMGTRDAQGIPNPEAGSDSLDTASAEKNPLGMTDTAQDEAPIKVDSADPTLQEN